MSGADAENHRKSAVHALWAEYSRRPRPPNIGDVIEGVCLGDLEDEVQDVLTSWAMGPELGLWRMARLGLAVADAERLLGTMGPGEAREYVSLLAELGRAALRSAARGELESDTADE